MRRLHLCLAAAAALTLAGCGSETPADPEEQRKAKVLAAVRSWYLFLDLLPAEGDAAADPKNYATADELLDALTSKARAEGKDRGWSYLLSTEQYQAYYQQGQNAGFGFGLQIKGSPPAQRLFVSQVFAGSAAAGAGFARGDEILAIGPDMDHLTPVANVPNDGSLSALFQSNAGSAKVFSVIPVGTGASAAQARTATAGTYAIDPVPTHAVLGTTGYVNLRTFITPAEAPLRAAFADFKAKGARNVVVDLRYNGGGYVKTAQILASLLAAGQAGKTMCEEQFNANHSGSNEALNFSPEANAGTFERVAFITTKSSASASELVPNALDPYLPIAFVGEKTYGKPVGQQVFELTGLDRELFLLSFKIANSAGNADYFDGLPDAKSRGPLCAAADDLTHPQESAEEASTKAALYFAENGTCPPATAGALRAAAAVEGVDYPRPRQPSPAQMDMPGVF